MFISIQTDSFEMPTIPKFMFHSFSLCAFLMSIRETEHWFEIWAIHSCLRLVKLNQTITHLLENLKRSQSTILDDDLCFNRVSNKQFSINEIVPHSPHNSYVENVRYFTENLISCVKFAWNEKYEIATLDLEYVKWECIETNKARLILIPLNVKTITELMKQIYLSCNATSIVHRYPLSINKIGSETNIHIYTLLMPNDSE